MYGMIDISTVEESLLHRNSAGRILVIHGNNHTTKVATIHLCPVSIVEWHEDHITHFDHQIRRIFQNPSLSFLRLLN